MAQVTLVLDEHGAALLLALVQERQERDEPVWRRYWRRLALTMERSIEAAYGRAR